MHPPSALLYSHTLRRIHLQVYATVAAKFGKKPGEPMMALFEKRAEAISGEFDSDDVSNTLVKVLVVPNPDYLPVVSIKVPCQNTGSSE